MRKKNLITLRKRKKLILKMNEIILLFILLALYPIVWYYGNYAKAGAGEKPLILNSVFIQFFLGLFSLVFIGLAIYLLIIDWKLFLLLFVVIFITGYIKGLITKRKK